MTEGLPQRSVLWPALRRFWPVALITAVVAGVSAMLLVEATSRPTSVSSATYVVPVAPPVTPLLPGQIPVAASPLPSSPGAAADFAEVYAVLLLEDGSVLEALSAATGREAADLVQDMQSQALPDGSVIRVTVTGSTAEESTAVLDALDAVLAAPTSVTANIPAGNLRPLNRGEVVQSAGLAPLAPAVGAIVGLLLGIGAAVVLERGDSRFRSGDDVRALVTWPVLALSRDPEDPRAEVLAERVRRARPALRSVALVGPRGTRAGDLEDLAWVLEEADRAHGGADVSWHAAGVLRGEGDTEQRAQDADALVLVVPPRARMRHLTTAVQAVEDLAVHPVVVALPSSRSRRARAVAASRREAAGRDGDLPGHPHAARKDDSGPDDSGPDDSGPDGGRDPGRYSDAPARDTRSEGR